MTVSTTGSVVVTPISLRTTATLQQIAAAMRQQQYRGTVPGRGWGSANDGDELLGRAGAERPSGGRAVLTEENDPYPAQLQARLYWNQHDASLRKYFGFGAEPHEVYRLEAADVIFTATDQAGVMLVLVTTRHSPSIRNFIAPALQELLAPVDARVQVLLDSSPWTLSAADDDFFRWLIYRYAGVQALDSDVSLELIRGLVSQDRLHRGASLGDAADLDRPELLAMLCGAATTFGPAKLGVRAEHLDLDADFELREDGGFAVYLSRSEYGDDPPRTDKGMRLIQDIAFNVVPRIRTAHANDAAWRNGGRTEFNEAARRSLRTSLVPPPDPSAAIANSSRIIIDSEAQVAYIRLADVGTVAHDTIDMGSFLVEVDRQGRPIGIEILDLSAFREA